MAKAINQNDLIDIIKSQVDSLSDIMTVVFKAASRHTMKLNVGTEAKMKVFKKQIDTVYGPKGILNVISSIKIHDIKPITWRDRLKIKRSIKNIFKLARDIMRSIPQIDPLFEMRVKQFIGQIKPINEMIEAITELIDSIKKISIKDLITIWWKSKLLIRAVKMIAKLGNRVGMTLGTMVINPITLVNLAILTLIIGAIWLITTILRSTKTFLISWKIRSITKMFRPLQRLISRINRLRGTTRAMIKMIKLAIFIAALKNMVINLIILIPLLIILVLLSPILIIGLLALIAILWVVKLVAMAMPKSVVLTFIVIGLIIIMICIIAAALVVLGMLALLLANLWIPIGLFFLGLLAVMVIIGLCGMIMAPLIEGLAIFLICIFEVLLIVAAVVAIAGILKLLEMIDLDDVKIKENVKKVISCIFSIVEALFESSYELMGGTSEDGPIKKLFLALVGGFAAYYGLMAMSKILMYAVATVAMILVIAGALWLIQKMDIDPEKVHDNVELVMDTCNGIINSLFFGKYEQPQPAKDDWQKEAVKYGAGLDIGFAKVIGAILAVVYVALIAVAILLLLVLAGMLWLLSKIPLDKDAVKTAVDNVMNCCDIALAACMGRGKRPNPEASSDTWLKDLIIYVSTTGFGIGSTILSVIEAIFAIAYVALMVIAIFLILLLAGMLWLLSKIPLDEASIRSAVDNVMNCCDAALAACMGHGKRPNPEASSNTWLKDLLVYVASGPFGIASTIISIFEAIIAILYVAIMIIAILLILVLAGLLKALEAIPLDAEQIRTNIDTVIGSCIYANDSVGGVAKDPSGGDSQSWWESIIQWGVGLFGSIGNIVQALLAIVFIALAVVSILLILILAGLLKGLESIPLDRKQIEENVKTVIGSAKFVNDMVSGCKSDGIESGEGESWWESILSWGAGMFGSIGSIIGALTSIIFIALAIVSTFLILILAKVMQPLSSIKLDEQNIKRNAAIVLNCAKYVADIVTSHVSQIEAKEDNKSIDFGLIKDFYDYVEDYYKPMFTRIKDLSDILYDLQNRLKDIDREKIVQGVKDILGTVTDVIQYLNTANFDMKKTERNLELLERTTAAIHKLGHVSNKDVENSRQITENYIKFIDKINASDFQKLDIAAQMFESFAILAESIKGDFDGLAECVNEDVMPVLKETQEMLEELPNELEKAGNDMARYLEDAAAAAGQRMAEALNSVSISSDMGSDMGGDFEMTTSSPAGTTTTTGAKSINESSSRWRADSLQDILDVMMGAGGGVRVRSS